MVRPQRDQDLRAHGQGFVSSRHLIQYPVVDPQTITANTPKFINNLFAPLSPRIFPETQPPVAKIRTDTVHPNTIVRFYQQLEGYVKVILRLQFIKTSVGANILIRGFAVSGVDLDENDTDHEDGVLTSLEFPGNLSNQNARANFSWDNDDHIPEFPGLEPGVDGAPDRRFIDTGIHFLITSTETIQLVDTYASLEVKFKP